MSKDDDILDHIDEKMVEPGIKKSVKIYNSFSFLTLTILTLWYLAQERYIYFYLNENGQFWYFSFYEGGGG